MKAVGTLTVFAVLRYASAFSSAIRSKRKASASMTSLSMSEGGGDGPVLNKWSR